MDFLPIFMNMRGAAALVVGGGDVAVRKARLLREAGCQLTVVAPECHPELAKAPQIVAGNKIDMAEPEQIERLKAYVEAKGYDYYSICAPIQEGTRELMNAVWNRLQTLPPVKEYEPEEIPTELLVQNSTGFTITNPEPGYYLVEAPWFPKVLKGIDVEDYEALQYMQRVLEKSGVFEALRQRGIQEGDIVSLYDIEFEYIP